MAREGLAQRAPGSTTVSESVERDWLKYENVDQFTEAYTAEIAGAMLHTWKATKSMSEAEIKGVADRKQHGFAENFRKFWSARGITVDAMASEAAWKKVRAKAIERYTKLKMQASAPPLPKREEVVYDVEPIPEEELPVAERPTTRSEQSLDIMDIMKWFKYDSMAFSNDTYHLFVGEFAPELAKAFANMSTDTAVRTYQMRNIYNLFLQKVFTMYCNRPDIKETIKQNDNLGRDALRRNIQGWLDERWEETYKAALAYKIPR